MFHSVGLAVHYQVFLFLPRPKCSPWPWLGEPVLAVPSATPGANSLLQLSAYCWHSETLRWQLSGNEITLLGYSLPLSGTWSTILTRQWKWFSSVKRDERWNIWSRQTFSDCSWGMKYPFPCSDRKFEIVWPCSAAGADADSGFKSRYWPPGQTQHLLHKRKWDVILCFSHSEEKLALNLLYYFPRFINIYLAGLEMLRLYNIKRTLSTEYPAGPHS